MVKKKTFIQGAIILTTANLITRVIGFIYRIVLSNLIGAEGMGIYQLTFPVYILSLSIVTGGFTVAVSTLVSRETSVGRNAAAFDIIHTTLKITVSMSVIISGIILFTSRWISQYILNDIRTYTSLLIFAPAILIISTSSIIRGFFEGVQDVTPNAIANIFEQISRVVVVLGLFYLLSGTKLSYSTSSAIAMFGNIIGEVFGFFYLSYVFHSEKKKYHESISKFHYLNEIITISLPLTINRVIINGLSTIDNIIIPQRLMISGLKFNHAIGLYGELSGMAMPLIFFPSIITNSLAVTLIPAIAEANSNNNYTLINRRVKKAVDVALIVGFGTMAIFLSLPNEIAGVLYNAKHVGEILFYLSFTIVLLFLNQMFISVLNGLNLQMFTFRNSFIASFVRLFFTYTLVALPHFGINGYVLSIIISYMVSNILDFLVLKKKVKISLNIDSFLKPCIAMLVAYIAIRHTYNFFLLFHVNTILNIFASLTTGGFVYILILLQFKMITLYSIKKLFHS